MEKLVPELRSAVCTGFQRLSVTTTTKKYIYIGTAHIHKQHQTEYITLLSSVVQPTFPLINFLTLLSPEDRALLPLSNVYRKHSPWETIFNSTVESNFPASDFGVNH